MNAKAILFIAGLFFFCQNLNSTHAVAFDIEYECLGNNQYKIALNFYRDCAGTSAPSNIDLSVSSVSCGVKEIVYLNLVSNKEVSQICGSQINNTTCKGGGYPGIQQYVYEAVYTLPLECSDWLLSYSYCCRNNAITNLNPPDQNLYAEALINNTNGICNSSPRFVNLPTPYVCLGEAVSYNHGVNEQDGDSLSYTLIQPRWAMNAPIRYVNGYSINNPVATMNGFNFNPQTGQMDFVPSQIQQAVVSMLIEERNNNGVLVGSITRDLQVIVLNCSNGPPTLTGVNVPNGSFDINLCAGTSSCFSFPSIDPDSDSIEMTWLNNIRGSIISNIGTPGKPEGQFCWTPTVSDIGSHYFSVLLKDDACPYPATNAYVFTINVAPPLDPPVVAESDTSACLGVSLTLNGLVDNSANSYKWSPSYGLSCTNCLNPSLQVDTNIIYTLEASYNSGCTLKDSVVISIRSPHEIDVYPQHARVCPNSLINFSVDTTFLSSLLWNTNSTASVFQYSANRSKEIILEYEDIYGCRATDTANYDVLPSNPTPQCSVVYVTPTGNGVGTKLDPSNLSFAISNAQCSNTLLHLSTGDYILDTALTMFGGGLTIEGGFQQANNWTKTSQPLATILRRSNKNVQGSKRAPFLSAIDISYAKNFSIHDVAITTDNSPLSDSFGISNYAIRIINSSDYDITRCVISSGNSSNGLNGKNGANGLDGSDGTVGEPGDCFGGNCLAGTGYTSPLGGIGGLGGGGTSVGSNGINRNGGGGGTGGNGSSECYNTSLDGMPGGGNSFNIMNTFFGKKGLSGNNPSDGDSAMPGSDGQNGFVALAALPYSLGNTPFFIPSRGNDGNFGLGGQGGAGGGGGGRLTCINCNHAPGDAGSGGGGGGQGGEAGKAGYGGGASIPIFIFKNGNNTRFIHCSVNGGQAGLGGRGGIAGLGGTGGKGAIGLSTCPTRVGEGGKGGDGGNGGSGSDGSSGLDGLKQNLFITGTPLVNSDLNFPLNQQPIITADEKLCKNREVRYSSTLSGSWNLGDSSLSNSQFGNDVSTSYLSLGRKDIQLNNHLYIGFKNITIDPMIQDAIKSSADSIGIDTFHLCVGSIADFWTNVSAIDYEWDFDGALLPNSYNKQNVLNNSFNISDTFDIKLRINTFCCGWTDYDSVVLVVEPYPTLNVTGDFEICEGEQASMNVVTTSKDILWTPNIYLSSDTARSVISTPPVTTSYQLNLNGKSARCNIDTLILIKVNEIPDLSNKNTSVVDCNNNGSAEVIPTRGSGSYIYRWNDPLSQTTNVADSLAAGNYQVIVYDSLTGCTDSTQFTITIGNIPKMTIANVRGITCFMGQDGNAKLAVNGGTQPYNFNWYDSNNNILQQGLLDSISGLNSGVFDIQLQDANGCIDSISFVVPGPPGPINLAVIDSVNPTCFSTQNGQIEVLATGGYGRYTYQWNDRRNQRTARAMGLDTGTYKVVVSDSMYCKDSVRHSFYSPTVNIKVDPGLSDTVCGSVFLLSSIPSTNNGWWEPVSGPGKPVFADSLLATTGIKIVDYGKYEFNWFEDNGAGCVDSAKVHVLCVEQPVADGGASIDSTCDLQFQISSIPSVGLGSWRVLSGPGSITFLPDSLAQNPNIISSAFGNYELVWSEDNGFGCISNDTITVIMTENLIYPSLDLVYEGCMPSLVVDFDSIIDTSIITSQKWYFGDGDSSYLVNPIHEYISSGCFDLTLDITTIYGCEVNVVSKGAVCVHELPIADFDFTPQYSTILTTGINFTDLSIDADYYSWNFAGLGTSSDQNPFHFFPTEIGRYEICLEVETINACKDTLCRDLFVDDEFNVFVPNSFTPKWRSLK